MDLDADIDFDAMRSFVKGMSAGGSRHVTMDDLADAERIRREDEEATRGGAGTGQSEESEEEGEDEDDEENSEDDDEEVERILGTQERTLIAEDDGSVNDTSDEDEEGEEGSSDDDDESPRRGFQARLERMRKKAEGKRPAVEEQDDSSDEAMSVHITWADEDDDFIASLEELLDDNADILLGNGKTRKQRKKLFRSVRNGEFDHDMYEEMMSPAKRMKDKDIPPELREQWERDRQKKAENKRLRAQARLELAADPLAEHKGGKKGRKAMLAAARLDPSADLPNRVTNLVTLEQQIRRFLDDVGGRETMVLPPASKEMRKRIHELASAFNLKSQSKGSGATRYTTLIKMTRSGIGINEKKVRRILKEADPSWIAPDWDRGRGKGKGVALPQHREGEVVGKAAPKIGESNVGFKMLAAMGWAEGDRIGLSGGLDAPLTAVIKKTKLGLGATL
ncbi:hypothetical protein CERSUDRAFT_160116 [Gelatoporia subvermispora B]|uniref:Protein SQS1 n=1 Tax=Ceriporiopsis subvermispora (strain B) TaxID=914234 RepID=M2R6J3_CERS8|nr:hypothetical protein CERSUDRAFT_160116 [Gelatoporia subvermispora B]